MNSPIAGRRQPEDDVHQHGHAVPDRSVEKIFSYAWASLIVAGAGALIWRGKPLADPNFHVWIRIGLSFAIAVLGATIPGFFKMGWRTAGGIGVRAGGALGLFLLTYAVTPTVLPPAPPLGDPSISATPPAVIDLRCYGDGSFSDEQCLAAQAVLTVPLQYASSAQPARSVTVEKESAELALPGTARAFRAGYFVNQSPEQPNKWLGVDGSWHPESLAAGQTLYHETLFQPVEPQTWGSLQAALDALSQDRLTVRVESIVSGRRIEFRCDADLAFYRAEVAKYRASHPHPPMRVTLPCLQS